MEAKEIMRARSKAGVHYVFRFGNRQERVLMLRALDRLATTYQQNRFTDNDWIPSIPVKDTREFELMLALYHLRDTKSYCITRIHQRQERLQRGFLP